MAEEGRFFGSQKQDTTPLTWHTARGTGLVKEKKLDITIEWQPPLQLSENNEPLIDQNNIPAELLDEAGVYFFARWFGGKAVEPLYIGQSLTLRGRLREHLQRKVIWDILTGRSLDDFDLHKGQKYFHYGYFRPKKGQHAKTCVPIVERAMIRQAIQSGFKLVNHNGIAPISTYNIFFNGPEERFRTFLKHTEIEALLV
jgi:hypothetical protein